MLQIKIILNLIKIHVSDISVYSNSCNLKDFKFNTEKKCDSVVLQHVFTGENVYINHYKCMTYVIFY